MNQGNLLRTAMNYGALSGLSCFAMFLLLYFLGFNPLGSASTIAIWIPIVFICLSTRAYRDHELEGFMTYKQGFKIGFLTAVFGGILYSLIIYIFGKTIDGNLVDNYKEEFISQMEATKSFFSERFYNMNLESIQKITLTQLASSDFFSKAIGGIIVSLVTAAIFKKQPPIIQS